MRVRTIPIAILLLAPVIVLGSLCMGETGWGWPSDTILQMRIERVAAGFVVGAALSVAGCVLQALLRNPLAEPYVLGVSGGAGLGAALAICAGWTAVSVAALPGMSFLFALAALWIVFRVSRSASGPSLYGLLLSGIMVSSICASLLMLLITLSPVEGMHSVTWWMMGSLQVFHPPLLVMAGSVALVCMLFLWSLAGPLDALTLGRDAAHHLGVSARRVVPMAVGAATLMTAAVVGLSGLIGFVGLIVPNGLRLIMGPGHRALIPAAGVGGGLFLVACDAVARVALAPRDIPVGVITALIGGPLFIALLRRRRVAGWVE